MKSLGRAAKLNPTAWHLVAARVSKFLADIGAANRFAFAAETPTLHVQIGDVTVGVGPTRFYAAEAEITSIEQLRRVEPTDPAQTAEIQPLGDGWFYAELLDQATASRRAFYRASPGTPLPESAEPTEDPDQQSAD